MYAHTTYLSDIQKVVLSPPPPFTCTHAHVQPSYVFQQRAITPAKYLKQQAYCGQLDEQVGHKQAQLRKASEREERMEKEERLQLAKE